MTDQRDKIYDFIGDEAGKTIDRDPTSSRNLENRAVVGAAQDASVNPLTQKPTFKQPKQP